MGALGLRGTVFASATTELALKTDLMWVRTTSAATHPAPGLALRVGSVVKPEPGR